MSSRNMAGSETCSDACCTSKSVLHRARAKCIARAIAALAHRPDSQGQLPLGGPMSFHGPQRHVIRRRLDRGRLLLAVGDREPDLAGGASAIWGRACDGGRSAGPKVPQGSDSARRLKAPARYALSAGLGWRARDVNSIHSLWAETGPGADEPAGLPWVRSLVCVGRYGARA